MRVIGLLFDCYFLEYKQSYMKQTLLILVVLINTHSFSQKIEVDIFNNLEHQSKKGDYKAYFKKDIFDNYEFTDTHKNKFHFNKKYIAENYPLVHKDQKSRFSFFKSLIQQHKQDYNLEVTHEIDIFGNENILDNRSNKNEVTTDIFDNKIYTQESNGRTTTLKKGTDGAIEYSAENFKASLEKDFRNNWVYEDNTNNKFTFSKKTWDLLISRHQTTENIFMLLLDEFTQP